MEFFVLDDLCYLARDSLHISFDVAAYAVATVVAAALANRL